MKLLADDCFLHDKDRLRHEEAVDILKERIEPVVGSDTLPLENAAGRILAKPVVAPRPIPAFDNSAVDGYAFSHADHEPTGGFFPLVTRIAAGEKSLMELPGFSAARIFTGAPMPQGADTVAMQEDCEPHEQDGTQYIIVPGGLKQGANCRLAGEDVQKGERVGDVGQMLSPQFLAAIASTGTSEIEVHAPLRIALLSTGDEILRPGQTFTSGGVYDANHFMLRGFLDKPCFEVTDIGISPDDETKVDTLLTHAAEHYDVVLSTGGASKGEEDYLIDVLSGQGSCHLWQLAVKPGRPMAFGQMASKPVFVLPGNPVAVFVCFLLYVLPCLQRLAGRSWKEPERFTVESGFTLNSKPDRREFLRGFLEQSEDGKTVCQKFERDGSGLITGLRQATGLIEIPEATTRLGKGAPVTFIPFSGLMH